jgi:ABC-type lipoprotein export system ATPase subunit
MSESLLVAKGLTKSYVMGGRSIEVLRGVDLEVARGDFLALRGASGAGKSTLLHLIGGLDSPNSGEILFDGRDIAKFSEGELTHFRNRRVGFIFQAYHLLPELTALENVCLPSRIGRVSAAVAESRATALLTQTLRTFRRRTAARRDSPFPDRQPGIDPGRRAHGQPGFADGAGNY